MIWEVDLVFLYINGIITIFCAFYIILSIYQKRLKRHWFYYAWSLGFLLYGIEILMRGIFNHMDFLLLEIVIISSFMFFSIGLWILGPKKTVTIFIALFIFLKISVTLFALMGIFTYNMSATIILSLLFVQLILLLFHYRLLFGRSIDRLLFGWLLLTITNILLLDVGWITDIFAIFSKLVILTGVMNQDFTLLIKRVREETKQIPSSFTGNEKEGGISLVISSNSSSKKTEWVKNKTLKNVNMNVDTFIFSFQDTISYTTLRTIKWLKPNKVHIFLFSASAKKAQKDFVVFPMKIVEIGAALHQVTQKKGCEIILLDISLLIHAFGTHSVYNMLLNKLGRFREKSVSVFAVFNPETHNDKSIPSLFENISDEIIKL